MKNATHAYTSHLAHSQFFNSEFFILNSPTQADRSPPGVIACMFDEPNVVIPLGMTRASLPPIPQLREVGRINLSRLLDERVRVRQRREAERGAREVERRA